MRVDAYIATDIKGPRKRRGIAVGALSCVVNGETKWAPEGIGVTGGDRLAEITALHITIKRLFPNKGSDVYVHTGSGYITHGLYSIRAWESSGWKRKDGKPIAHVEYWKEIANHLHGNNISVLPEDQEATKRLLTE